MSHPGQAVVRDLDALDGFGVGGRSFDHYARLATRLLGVPVSLVSLVEAERQVFPGELGLPEPWHSARQTPLTHSFCQYVVRDEKPLLITDARRDARLRDNLAIRDLNAIAYAGVPLLDGAGRTIGSLCAIDSEPRVWTPDELGVLEDLALACSAELQQARESESLTRTIFDSVDVAMAFYDVEGRLIVANDLARRAVEACGFRLDQPPYAGAYVRRSDNRTPVPFEEQIIPRALRQELHDHEMEWIGPPGNESGIVASSQQVLHTDGSPWGTLITAYDVTDLARSLQVREEFIATVSHELRTPLASISAHTQLLSEELDDKGPFVTSALQAIARGTVRLQERISELLDTAERRRALDLESADVSSLAHRTFATFGTQVASRGRNLIIDADRPQWAVLDTRRVEQALENLVSNAVKYTNPGGTIEISTDGDDGYVYITVRDDGVGMSPDEVSQACDSFWRAGTARRGAIQGIGIGLTRVREILTAHHGDLDISSQLGEGTQVTLTLPRSALGLVG